MLCDCSIFLQKKNRFPTEFYFNAFYFNVEKYVSQNTMSKMLYTISCTHGIFMVGTEYINLG